MKYLLKPSQLQSLLDLASKGLISPDTPFDGILPVYRPSGKKRSPRVPLERPRLPQDELVATFRRRLTEPWVGLCSELYDALNPIAGSTLARTFINPQALGWHLKDKIEDGDSAYAKKRSNRGQVYTIQPLAEGEQRWTTTLG